MRNKKFILITILILSEMPLFFHTPVYAQEKMPANTSCSISCKIISTTLDTNIKWRYKTKNGKLYKRLYDYKHNTWIGDWILVE